MPAGSLSLNPLQAAHNLRCNSAERWFSERLSDLDHGRRCMASARVDLPQRRSLRAYRIV